MFADDMAALNVEYTSCVARIRGALSATSVDLYRATMVAAVLGEFGTRSVAVGPSGEHTQLTARVLPFSHSHFPSWPALRELGGAFDSEPSRHSAYSHLPRHLWFVPQWCWISVKWAVECVHSS